MRRILAILGIIFGFTGCTNDQLRHNTVRQARTIIDVEHQQVASNLAAFAFNPEAIPFHVNLHDGTAQITDNGSIVSQVLYLASLSVGAQRTVVDQWTMTPITDDIPLKLLQVAYRRAFGSPEDLYTNDLANDLAHELKKQTATVDDLRTLVGNSPNDDIAKLITVPDFKDLATEVVSMSRTVRETRIEDGRQIVTERQVPVDEEVRVAGFDQAAVDKLRPRFDAVISSNDSRIVQEGEILDDNNLVFALVPGRPPQSKPLYKTATPLAVELRRQVKDVNDSLLKIVPGFVHRSRDKHDVPHNACYKGHFRDCCGESYVWVCANDRGEFEKFTVTILSLSSLIKDPNIVGVSGVRYSPGTNSGFSGMIPR